MFSIVVNLKLVEWRKENSLDSEMYFKYAKKPELRKQAKQQDIYFEVYPEYSSRYEDL